MYLKNVDRYADLSVNCLITPSNAKLLVLHNGQMQEDRIKEFLNSTYDLFSKLAMNPFFSQTEKIQIDQFTQRVITFANKSF